MGLLWSDLFDRPGRLAVELNKVGTTSRFLVLDLRDAARDNSTLQTELDRVGPAGWLLLALEWFGDLDNPQPTNRTLWSGSFRTPDWTAPRLPPLDEEEKPATPTRVTIEPDLSGRPLPAVAVLEALRSYAAGASIRDVGKGSLSYRLARRVFTWVASGAAWWDPVKRTPRTAPAYRLVGGGPPDSPTLQLVRI